MLSKKILIVDDDEVYLRLAEHDLIEAGYTVTKAMNGKEALTKAKADRPDLILLDVQMPELDGTEVIEAFREDPLMKKVPVIFLTGILTRAEEERLGHVIGGNFFLAKPYRAKELLEEIQKRI